MRFCDETTKKENQDTDEEKAQFEKYPDDGQDAADNTVFIAKTLRHVKYGPSLWCIVRSYGYNKSEDTKKLAHQIPRHVIDAYWDSVENHKERKAFVGAI